MRKFKLYFRKTGFKKDLESANLFLDQIYKNRPKNFLEVGVFQGVTGRNVCEVPQSLIEKSIRKGKIKVNNKKKKSSYKLQKNDQIFVYNFNFKISKNKKIKTKYRATKKELSSSSGMFIENNENFVVINKPAGLQFNRVQNQEEIF